MAESTTLSDASTKGGLIRWARLYDKAVGVITFGREAAMRQQTLELAALQPGERVLDVGCGTGTLTIEAARVGACSEIVGIDPAAAMIERARDKAGAAGVGVRFEVGVVESLAFEDGHFDAVLSSLMLHHLPPSLQKSGLAEVYRVLRPGGRLVLVDFAGPGPWMHRMWARIAGHGHEHASTDRLSAWLSTFGFQEIEQHTMSPAYLVCTVARKPR